MNRDRSNLARGQAGPGHLSLLPIIGLSAFFTLADLFGPQSISQVLATTFAASAPRMGLAINAAIAGMISAGLFGTRLVDRFNRKHTLVGVLGLLTAPTALLAFSGNLEVFELLRFAQGFLMCLGFIVVMAYVSEEWGSTGAAPALMGAYLTGNVAANLFGRMIAGAVAEYSNWHNAFLVFSGFNLVGSLIIYLALPNPQRDKAIRQSKTNTTAIASHLRNPAICGACGVGFLILFTFVGTFTYVNFYLANPPFNLSAGTIGFIYLVFSPALLTTLFVGRAVRRFGYHLALMLGSATALIGFLLAAFGSTWLLLIGLGVIGCGLFFSQAVATGFVGHAAAHAKAAASGLYLAAYYTGGLCGAWAMGLIFLWCDWLGCVVVGASGTTCMMLIAVLTWSPDHNVKRFLLPASMTNALIAERAP